MNDQEKSMSTNDGGKQINENEKQTTHLESLKVAMEYNMSSEVTQYQVDDYQEAHDRLKKLGNAFQEHDDIKQEVYRFYYYCIEKYIYSAMNVKLKLFPVTIPIDCHQSEEKSVVFVSSSHTNSNKLLILANDENGKAGYWSSEVMIRNSITKGSQIPYISNAIRQGYHVLVINPFQNTNLGNPDSYVRGSETPKDHILYAWNHFVDNSSYEEIFIAAHGDSGKSMLKFITQNKCVRDRITAAALINSSHTSSSLLDINIETTLWLNKRCINYVVSENDVNAFELSQKHDCQKRSAGTLDHQLAPWNSMHCIFQFFDDMTEERDGVRYHEKIQPTLLIEKNIRYNFLSIRSCCLTGCSPYKLLLFCCFQPLCITLALNLFC